MTGLSRLKSLAAAATVLLAGAGSAPAGELSLAWARSHDDVTAGYLVEVLDTTGTLVDTLDAKDKTRATVTGLADGTLYRFRIRPYDQWGHNAKVPSAEIVTMAAPRIDMLSRWDDAGGTATLELLGANFAPGARVVARRTGLVVGETTVVDTGRLQAVVKNPGGVSPMAEDFLVVNPVRRSEEYLDAHPELTDIDQDGAVAEADAQLVARAFGAAGRVEVRAAAAGAGPRPELDVNGDGLIDGEDVAAVRARMAAASRTNRTPKGR